MVCFIPRDVLGFNKQNVTNHAKEIQYHENDHLNGGVIRPCSRDASFAVTVFIYMM